MRVIGRCGAHVPRKAEPIAGGRVPGVLCACQGNWCVTTLWSRLWQRDAFLLLLILLVEGYNIITIIVITIITMTERCHNNNNNKRHKITSNIYWVCLLCARHYAKCHISSNSFETNTPYEIGTIFIIL